MNNNPKISVIVPVYNVENYLHRCIDSILAQTFTDLELLLIDDGSTDKSGKICDEYAAKDKRIMVFHKANGGVSSARNLGLENATGKFVWFIDSDDWIQRNALELLLHEIVIKKADVAFFDFHAVSTFNAIVPYTFDKICGDNNEKLYVGINACSKAIVDIEMCGGMGWTWNKILRRSIIQRYNIRFDTRFAIQEDHLFTFSYLKHVSSILILNDKLYNYVMSDNSLLGKSYSYINTKERNDAMYKCRCELCSQFNIKDSEYIKWFTMDYASRNISNLLSLNNSNLSLSQKKEEISKVNLFLNETGLINKKIIKYKLFNWFPQRMVLWILSKIQKT